MNLARRALAVFALASSSALPACDPTTKPADTGTDTDTDTAASNQAPVVGSVTFFPLDVTPVDTVMATVSATDPDEDILQISYAWLLDGVPFTEGPMNAIPISAWRPGQTFQVQATVSDGTDEAVGLSPVATVVGCPTLDLDGVDDVGVVSATPALGIPGDMSAEAWIFPEAGAATQRVFGHAGGAGWRLELVDDTTVRFVVGDEGGAAEADVTPGAWHHVAGVLDDGVTTLYVDGAAVGTGTGTLSAEETETTALGIGGDPADPTAAPWAGKLGPLRTRRAPTYTATFTPTWFLQADAQTGASWAVHERSGTRLADHADDGLHAELTGGEWRLDGCP